MDNGQRGVTGRIAVKVVRMEPDRGHVAASSRQMLNKGPLVQGTRNSQNLVIPTCALVSIATCLSN